MELGYWRISLLLLVSLVLANHLDHFQGWKGFEEKPMSKKNMNLTLKFFIESYNNASNDTYLFRVDKLLRSQMQPPGSRCYHVNQTSLGRRPHQCVLELHFPRALSHYGKREAGWEYGLTCQPPC